MTANEEILLAAFSRDVVGCDFVFSWYSQWKFFGHYIIWDDAVKLCIWGYSDTELKRQERLRFTFV